MMPDRKRTGRSGSRPHKFRVVGHVSRLPAPVHFVLGDGQVQWVYILTKPEWDALPPGDDPGGFREIRTGIYSRFCEADGTVWD